MHGEYDVLLLDCQPIFISADTEYLARMADATLLVVESGMVLKHDLLRAAHLLERLPVPSVAVVLNQLSLDRADLSLREDLREFVTYGRGFAHGKPIPLTTTRHQDYPVAPPGSYESADEAGEPITDEPPFPPYYAPEPAPHVEPQHEDAPIAEEPPTHDQAADIAEDRSEGRNDDYDAEDEHT
jgi:hypothetical protein